MHWLHNILKLFEYATHKNLHLMSGRCIVVCNDSWAHAAHCQSHTGNRIQQHRLLDHIVIAAAGCFTVPSFLFPMTKPYRIAQPRPTRCCGCFHWWRRRVPVSRPNRLFICGLMSNKIIEDSTGKIRISATELVDYQLFCRRWWRSTVESGFCGGGWWFFGKRCAFDWSVTWRNTLREKSICWWLGLRINVSRRYYYCFSRVMLAVEVCVALCGVRDGVVGQVIRSNCNNWVAGMIFSRWWSK